MGDKKGVVSLYLLLYFLSRKLGKISRSEGKLCAVFTVLLQAVPYHSTPGQYITSSQFVAAWRLMARGLLFSGS